MESKAGVKMIILGLPLTQIDVFRPNNSFEKWKSVGIKFELYLHLRDLLTQSPETNTAKLSSSAL